MAMAVGAAASASCTLRGICDTCRRIKNQNASRLFNLCCENRQPQQPQPPSPSPSLWPVWSAKDLCLPTVIFASTVCMLRLELASLTLACGNRNPFRAGDFRSTGIKTRCVLSLFQRQVPQVPSRCYGYPLPTGYMSPPEKGMGYGPHRPQPNQQRRRRTRPHNTT